MTCRDCGGPRDAINPRIRMDICSWCMRVRASVLKSVESGSMSLDNFRAYQKNGLRTKRLIKMGYGPLVDHAKPAPPAPRGEEGK